MVKRFSLALLALLSLSACCTHRIEKGALRDLEDKQAKYFSKYIAYVVADAVFGGAALSPEQRERAKDDEKKAVKAIQDQTRAIRESLEE